MINIKAITPEVLGNFFTRISNVFANKEHSHTTVNGHTVESNVPSNAKFTDTTPNNATVTINQAGVKKGTFTTNQSGDATINLDGETILTGTLPAGSTSMALTSSSITTESLIDVYASIYGVAPTSINVKAGSITLGFKSQSSAMSVKVVVR